MHDRTDEPEPFVTLDDDREQDRLVELVATVSVTVPLKPLSGTTARVDVAATPTFTVTLVGLAPTVKS